jgi:hypothetical protein
MRCSVSRSTPGTRSIDTICSTLSCAIDSSTRSSMARVGVPALCSSRKPTLKK